MKVQTNTHQNKHNVSHLNKYCLSLSDLLRNFPPHSKRFFFAYFLSDWWMVGNDCYDE